MKFLKRLWESFHNFFRPQIYIVVLPTVEKITERTITENTRTEIDGTVVDNQLLPEFYPHVSPAFINIKSFLRKVA